MLTDLGDKGTVPLTHDDNPTRGQRLLPGDKGTVLLSHNGNPTRGSGCCPFSLGVAILLENDLMNRLLNQQVGADTVSYTYDSFGNILTMDDLTGRTSYVSRGRFELPPVPRRRFS